MKFTISLIFLLILCIEIINSTRISRQGLLKASKNRLGGHNFGLHRGSDKKKNHYISLKSNYHMGKSVNKARKYVKRKLSYGVCEASEPNRGKAKNVEVPVLVIPGLGGSVMYRIQDPYNKHDSNKLNTGGRNGLDQKGNWKHAPIEIELIDERTTQQKFMDPYYINSQFVRKSLFGDDYSWTAPWSLETIENRWKIGREEYENRDFVRVMDIDDFAKDSQQNHLGFKKNVMWSYPYGIDIDSLDTFADPNDLGADVPKYLRRREDKDEKKNEQLDFTKEKILEEEEDQGTEFLEVGKEKPMDVGKTWVNLGHNLGIGAGINEGDYHLDLDAEGYFSQKTRLVVGGAWPTSLDSNSHNIKPDLSCNVYKNHLMQSGLSSIDALVDLAAEQFSGYIDEMVDEGYQYGRNLVGAPYDWRYAPYTTVADNPKLEHLIQACEEPLKADPQYTACLDKGVSHFCRNTMYQYSPNGPFCTGVKKAYEKMENAQARAKVPLNIFLETIPTFAQEKKDLEAVKQGVIDGFTKYEWVKEKLTSTKVDAWDGPILEYFNTIVSYKCPGGIKPQLTNCHFLQLLTLIKKHYYINGGKKLHVVAHSNGNNLFRHLLENYPELEHYVAKYIAVSHPAGGAAKTLTSITTGAKSGISGVVSDAWMEHVAYTWPVSSWILPKKEYEPKLPVKLGKIQYGVAQSPSLSDFVAAWPFPGKAKHVERSIKLIGAAMDYNIDDSIASQTKIFIHNVYSVLNERTTIHGVDTMWSKQYAKWKSVIQYGMGDGTVPLKSFFVQYRNWNKNNRKIYVVRGEFDHCDILLSDNFIKFVKSVNLGTTIAFLDSPVKEGFHPSIKKQMVGKGEKDHLRWDLT